MKSFPIISDDALAWRTATRKKLIAARFDIGRKKREQWSDSIGGLLLHGFPILQWMIVGFYWPRKGAFNPRPFMRLLCRAGATAATANPTNEGGLLQFEFWLPKSAIRNQKADQQEFSVVHPEALLVPMIGFDEQGHRLGDGSGAFDRTIPLMFPQPLKIGVAYEVSRIWTIHPQPHDIPMDFIVTEQQIYCVKGGRLEPIADTSSAMELARRIILGRGCDDASMNSRACRRDRPTTAEPIPKSRHTDAIFNPKQT